MLKLKRVELHGFKSFCDRTELKFHGGGIAAVVGPNGCGKSNLSDAISWVLGEQSAKSLRGSRMEDVIFAGTRDRKPLGLASVTMTLYDPDYDQRVAEAAEAVARAEREAAEAAEAAAKAEAERQATLMEAPDATEASGNEPAAETEAVAPESVAEAGDPAASAAPDNVAEMPAPAEESQRLNGHARIAALNGYGPEITITRRLFRSGDSEYLINGKMARLRDIQDLFMGTGLGPESYAIIEQGRIGQILSSKPQDRRAVIEEAAGISKYKTKRRLSEAKLESAKQNLERVFDILEEVTRQVNSLKRQASKSKRYGELKVEMEAKLRVVLASRFHTLNDEAAKAQAGLNAATEEIKGLTEQLTASEAEYTALRTASYETEQKLTEARAQLAQLNVELERTRGRLESQAKESGNIEQRIAQGERDTAELEGRITALEAELAGHRRTVEELDGQTVEVRERLAETNQAREGLQTRLREKEKSIEANRVMVLKLLGEASTLKNQLAQIDEYLAGIDRETARIEREEEAAAAESERLTAARDGLSQQMAERQLELESVGEQRKRTEEELQVRRRTAHETRQGIDGLRGEVSKIRARKDSLEDILNHRTYTTESVKRLFGELEKGKQAGFKPMGVLADFVDVDKEYEKASEEFLHDELEYVVVQKWQDAATGLEFVRGELDGRVTFLVHPDENMGGMATLPEPAIGPETGIVGRLSDSLRLTNGLRERASDLLPRVSRCFLAEDHAAAQRLAGAYPHLFFLLRDGICYHGQTLTGGRKNASGPLALKREARELGEALAGKQAQLDAQVALLEDLQNEIVLLEGELERLRGLQQSREKDAVALNGEIRKLGEEMNRAQSRISVARLDLERVRRERERSFEQRERNQIALEEKEALRSQREEALEAEREELESIASEGAAITEQHSTLRAQLAGLEERQRGERAATARLENQLREVTHRRAHIAADMERWGVQRARLLADNIELETRTGTLAEQIAGIDAQVNEMALREAGEREQIAVRDGQLKQMRGALQQLQETRAHTEIELVKRQEQLKYLDETSRKELNLAVEELAQTQEAITDETALQETEAAYNELRSKIEALGPVNPSAWEEFQEAQQRHDFLSAQRKDLLDSIRDTEKAIHEIEQISRKRFAEAFETINENFRECFRTLFGGGMGEMRLTDPENVNESGIDIVASPPGKRLQNVLLLSGGEKSLAAMALLMAIFRYQPSPFCILDEVDAPLDEANIERLTRLLREMSRQTQFIVITHSKKTMESAQSMYGVTMQEPGVSRLVSVKFQPAEVREVA